MLFEEPYLYVAQDGNYGDPHGLLIVDTADWTSDDWYDLEMTKDQERVTKALEINKNKEVK